MNITVTLTAEAEATIMAYLKDDFTNAMASRANKAAAQDAALVAVGKAMRANHYREMANDLERD